mmetsp:Transcript_3316/g.11645  ORF Transcript_3316/g.11645 Transcript_3316/m.11645 type:complete len:314 (+) Transcript_3316:410-1351(+)
MVQRTGGQGGPVPQGALYHQGHPHAPAQDGLCRLWRRLRGRVLHRAQARGDVRRRHAANDRLHRHVPRQGVRPHLCGAHGLPLEDRPCGNARRRGRLLGPGGGLHKARHWRRDRRHLEQRIRAGARRRRRQPRRQHGPAPDQLPAATVGRGLGRLCGGLLACRRACLRRPGRGDAARRLGGAVPRQQRDGRVRRLPGAHRGQRLRPGPRVRPLLCQRHRVRVPRPRGRRRVYLGAVRALRPGARLRLPRGLRRRRLGSEPHWLLHRRRAAADLLLQRRQPLLHLHHRRLCGRQRLPLLLLGQRPPRVPALLLR